MAHIHVLDEATINKIAAGEVVERPASVIKELLENAVDAGATSIDVEIAEGGVAYMRVTDNGIGMTKEELEKNLGTIARSGSLDFKAENHAEDIDIIGQFGVGFYSAFMVASRVTVISKAFGSDEAWMWESKGAEGYTLTQTEKAEAGTQIILVIKENTEQV